MAFVPIANCTMCKLRWSANTNLCENTLAFYWSGTPPTGSELNSLAAAIAGDVGFYFRQCMSNSILFNTIVCANQHAPGGAQGIYSFPANTRGFRIGSTVALSEASGITRRTGFTGRSNRGRNSVSGFSEGDVDGNSITGTLMSLLGDLAVHILVPYLAGRFLPGVASRTNHTIIPLLSAAVLDDNIDSQKTRLNTHGT